MTEQERTEVVFQAVLNAKENITSFEELKPLTDEYMLRWYIYGDFEERNPCQIYELVSTGKTAKDKFNPKFVYTLIEHLIKCDKCNSEYSQSHSSGDTTQ